MENGEDIVRQIQSWEKPFIFIKGRFVKSKQVAVKFYHDCGPFLYQLPEEFFRFEELMMQAGVRESFTMNDFVESLQNMKSCFGENSLDEKSLGIAVTLASELQKCILQNKKGNKIGTEELHLVYLPSDAGVLHPSFELCIKDCYWMPDEEGIIYAHKDIPPQHAVKLGVNTRRQETLRRCYQVIPFGQKEKLTNRLKRLLTVYPFQKEILKELLQNADDAQATKICFIKDPRQHPDERVFEDSWKPLQGPALCVYNNRPFTKADLCGIQNLGEGSKGDDPNKTGQYGVGFNAVYHLTDVPTFMTKGDEIGEILCAFDPHCKFVPVSTKEEPGMMIKVPSLRNTFTDVFPCYLEDLGFPINNATMFRFPLRSSEMALESKISNKDVSVCTVDELMEELRLELFEVLLFVNNVQEISLCEVNKNNGKLCNMYTVEAAMTDEDANKRKEFSNYIKEMGRKIQKGEISAADVEIREVSYTLELKDNKGKGEEWFVIQRIGFEHGEGIPDSITAAFRKGDLALLPRGGVAACIKSSFSQEKQMKSFCFLPLPDVTGLPVHINGHFALDHEGRRGLLKAETVSKAWNTLVLRSVVVPCYASLLSQVRGILGLSMDSENKTKMQCKRTDICLRLENHQKFFPSTSLQEPYWTETAMEAYRYINRNEMRLLPVVRDCAVDQPRNMSVVKENNAEIMWVPPTGKGNDQAFFNDLRKDVEPIYRTMLTYVSSAMGSDSHSLTKRIDDLKNLLLRLNFNLIEAPLSLWKNFVNSSVEVECVSPQSVTEFFQTYTSANPLCRVGELPTKIEETPFEKVCNLELLLKYCNRYDSFTQKLDGLPLLLTQDETLQVFESSNPKFLSAHLGILPGSASDFVHQTLYNIWYRLEVKELSIFKTFSIEDFAKLLPHSFPELCSGSVFIPWEPKGTTWLQHVWRFLESQTKEIFDNKQLSDQCKRDHVTERMRPLKGWSLLPVTETVRTSAGSGLLARQDAAKHYLVPIGKSETVIDFHECVGTVMIGNYGNPIAEVLRKFGLPELNHRAIQGDSQVPDRVKTAMFLVATLDNPATVLVSLLERLAKSKSVVTDVNASTSHCQKILVYFNDRLKVNPSVNMLQQLPFYETVQGDLIQLNSVRAYVLPCTVPSYDMHVWKDKAGTVFLKSLHNLKELYKYIGCFDLTETQVYTEFIFQHFEDMSAEGRMKHLAYLKGHLLPSDLSLSDRKKLLDGLRYLRFIPSQTGELLRPCDFYDPINSVFAVMFSESTERFPPPPFSDPSWLSFLRQIGMIFEVTIDQFITFARQVAIEAVSNRSKTAKAKSAALLNHLFGRKNLATEGILQRVCDIPFIYPAAIEEDLLALCPPYGLSPNQQLPFISFKGSLLKSHQMVAWSCASILPFEANPRKNFRYHEYDDYKSFEAYVKHVITALEILEKPTPKVVVSHCIALCLRHAEQKVFKQGDSKIRTLYSVMRKIYSFLGNVRGNCELDQLKITDCVMVDGGRRFVLPKQIVVDILLDDEITPFLYKLPVEIGMHAMLFLELGASKKVTADQYALVLQMIHDQAHGSKDNEKLNPNEMTKSYQAVKGLFARLLEDCPLNVPTLFLPATRAVHRDQKPSVFLNKSTEIVFNDAPHFRGRIEEFDKLMLVDLKECDLKADNFGELVLTLPKNLQPQMLTAVVNERLVENAKESKVQLGAAFFLKNLLMSCHFVQGIVRLIRHEDKKAGSKTNEILIARVKQAFQCVEVYGVRHLVAHLIYDGTNIPGSEKEKSCFAEKVQDSGKESWNIYIQSSTQTHHKALLSRIAEVVGVMTKGLLRGSSIHLPLMLECQINEIEPFLDDLGIREDHSMDISWQQTLPQPGEFIHIDDHHLLVNQFEDFEPGEYVGYELEDPSLEQEEGTPTYIYAIIIEEVFDGTEGHSHLTKKYRINVGNDREPIVAEAVDLYKFHRVKGTPSKELEIYHGEKKPEGPDPKVSNTLEQVMEEVSDVLEEAWKLPKEKKMKIVKRLFLSWHPDKNPGHEEFCTKVFQHIQNEIERLERGEPRRKTGSSASSSGTSYRDSDSFSFFYSRWNTRASSHRNQWYHTSSSSYGSSDSNYYSYHRPNPQPGEARRWFRQAEADCNAAANDVAGYASCHEWACFKYHQAAEKALKAAQYSKDANKTSFHDLGQNAMGLNDSELSDLACRLESLLGGSARMRYPDRMCFPKIPHDVYTDDMSRRARELARQVLERVRRNFIA